MKALLLVAHGSRREESNDEVRRLATRLAERAATRYPLVRCAFLELAEPSIPDGIEACIRAGAREVVVLPYFLSAGNHVVEDIPALVAAKSREHPGVTLRIAPYLGTAAPIPELLLELAD
ncbi:MAG TPA: CbiX/SirB N-terminal domain-containing protein [Candidatus Competibacteraceae bacterium]|nr:CbiX/SirB N-terminal domain-containing protein [Candidatus Competibacteraceae bacterium]